MSTADQRAEKLADAWRDGQALDRELFAVDPETSQTESGADLFICKGCRRKLFTQLNLLDHESGSGQASFKWVKRDKGSSSKACTSHFIEPLAWLSQVELNEGKISCPKCDYKLGSFSWSGAQCSCGQWVTPAFQIPHSRVDKRVPLPLSRTPVAMPSAASSSS